MIGPSAVVAALLAIAAPVQGSLFTTVRYTDWYGGYSSKDGFNSNTVARRPWDTKHRAGAYWPSLTESVLSDTLEFSQHTRPGQTYIFNGIIKVPACRSGVYRFRISVDDATDLFIDDAHVLTNPGRKKGVSTMETAVHIKPGVEHEFELWWGNYDGPTSLKVEYCFSSAATFAAKEAGALSAEEGAPSLADVELGAVEADNSCVFTTDMSGIFMKQNDNAPAIKRCDYAGFSNGWIKGLPKTNKMMINDVCTLELGGVIHLDLSKTLEKTSYSFEMKIVPRATGTHTFWTYSDDGSELWVDSRNVVNNNGKHDDRSQQGSIFLKKGQEYNVLVTYGNNVKEGQLRVHWADPLSPEPQASFLPILQPYN